MVIKIIAIIIQIILLTLILVKILMLNLVRGRALGGLPQLGAADGQEASTL